jgi:hypothetical protein
MSANGTIVTNDIKPFKGTGLFRSSAAVDIEASKQKFLDNYAAGNSIKIFWTTNYLI